MEICQKNGCFGTSYEENKEDDEQKTEHVKDLKII